MKWTGLLAAVAGCIAASAGDVRTAYVFSASHLDITFTGMPPLSYARAHRIFDAALELAERQDTFRFVIENQYFLSEYLRTHPEKVSRLAAAIRKGRIELAGQWTSMLQNVVTGEDLARNILYAMELARTKLNTTPRMQSLSDAPGQTGQLPQLLNDAGLSGVLFTRAGPKDAPMFEWEGLDGSRTRALNPPGGYAGGYLMGLAESLEAMEGSKPAEFELSDISPDLFPNRLQQPASLLQFLQFSIPKGLDRALVEVSWDNAMPPERLAANITEWNKRHKEELLLVPAFPSDFLRDHWPAKAALKKGDIPSVWFNGGWTLIGGYQSHIRTSHELVRAEKWAALAQVLLGKEYPAEDLRRGWQQHLITLDHEGGGLTFQAHDAEATALRIAAESRQALASHVANPGSQDIALVVSNPLNWKRTGVVSAEVAIVGDPFAFFTRPWHKLRLIDSSGHDTPFQIVDSKSTIIRTLQVRFRAEDVPSMGWKTYYLRPADDDRSQKFPPPETISGNATFDAASGTIKLGADVELRYYHQPETTSSTPGFFRKRDSGSPIAVQWNSVRSSKDIRGTVLQLEGTILDARLTLDILAAEGHPLEVHETLRWRGGKPIKLIREAKFGTDGEFVYGSPFGERRLGEVMPESGPPVEGSNDELPQELWQKSREHDGWLEWKGKLRTVALAGESRGTIFEGSTAKTVVFYSDGSPLRPDPGQTVLDEFRTHFLVDLNSGEHSSARLGFEAYNPLEVTVSVNKLSGDLPPEYSGVADSPGSVLTTLKRAETGSGFIARAYALSDGAPFPALKFGSLSSSNLLEQRKQSPTGPMKKFEIRTVRIDKK